MQVNYIPINANFITSHMIYRVKLNDYGAKMIISCIAPHVNEDYNAEGLKTDSATCAPTSIQLLLSLETIFKIPLAKIISQLIPTNRGREKKCVSGASSRICKYIKIRAAAHSSIWIGE